MYSAPSASVIVFETLTRSPTLRLSNGLISYMSCLAERRQHGLARNHRAGLVEHARNLAAQFCAFDRHDLGARLDRAADWDWCREIEIERADAVGRAREAPQASRRQAR